MPAKAGIQGASKNWALAFAGATAKKPRCPRRRASAGDVFPGSSCGMWSALVATPSGEFDLLEVREELPHRPGHPALQRRRREVAAGAGAAHLHPQPATVEVHQPHPTPVVLLDVRAQPLEQGLHPFLIRDIEAMVVGVFGHGMRTSRTGRTPWRNRSIT